MRGHARPRNAINIRSILFAIFLLAVPACQQDMSKQPYYRPLESSSFFPDDRAARPIPPGTVARNRPLPGSALVSAGSAPVVPGSATANPAPNMQFTEQFPFTMKEADLKRGRERYEIFCAICHDPLGTGHGKIVERGYLQPPSYHTDLSRGYARFGIHKPLRSAPAGYYFHVITDGYGGMPDYRSQIPPDDRWRIVAYIRALELSQHAALADLPPSDQEQARKKLEAK